MVGNGDRGVELFFVISGMILAVPFARHYLAGMKPPSLRKYYMRRLTRLEPPYLVSTLFVVVGYIVYSHGYPAGYLPHILASLFYQHSLIYGSPGVNPVTWSLEVEIQFYVLAPIVMLLFAIPHKLWRRGAIVTAMLSIGLAQLPFEADPRFGFSLLHFLQYFLAGLLVADIFVLDLGTMKSSWAWDIAGVLMIVAIFWPEHGGRWVNLMLPFPICILCVAALRSYVLRRFFANSMVAVIGGMCYSIYLLHFVWIAVFFRVTRRLIIPSATFFENYLIQLVVVGLPVLLASVIFFVLVERPCMDPDWPSHLWQRVSGRRGDELAALDSGGISE